MDAYVNPYREFIDVLAHRHAGEHRKALTGELIAAYAEMNNLLASTKGKLTAPVWYDCADELERCTSIYTTAWRRFASEISQFLLDADLDVSPSLGPETTQAFQASVDGLRAALDVMRRASRQVGCESWIA
ncbi:hypothetical protein [Streptomyces beijiangensis]|uniref:Uncharacterized protein n=1 Tax=Streptomyces beijiangensis TaxID=163361 RepID=A0A939JKZ7_9ACTN|nr:hypothetical protein [Streptomyces beijiangensis]MBO0515209.1 hypothetical protein [Streptomyces beijiangensis]